MIVLVQLACFPRNYAAAAEQGFAQVHHSNLDLSAHTEQAVFSTFARCSTGTLLMLSMSLPA